MNNHRCLLFLVLVVATLLDSCKSDKDPVVAEVYHSKLYLSEIIDGMPQGISPQDSTILLQKYIDNWIREQVIIHEAEKTLSHKEKNFEADMNRFRNNLLINAYYENITLDSMLFEISDEELHEFLKKYEKRYTIDREIIKINYVKVSRNSKLITPIKSILFDESRRKNDKPLLEKLCADSIEYFLEDDTWLYLDDIQNEFPIVIEDKDFILTTNKYLEADDAHYHYMIVFLDYRTRRTVNETNEEIAAAKLMLLQQKKRDYINSKINQIYQKALDEDAIVITNR